MTCKAMPPEVLPSGIRSHADGFRRMAEALRAKVEASLHGQDEETKAALLGGPSLEAPINTVADKWKLLPAFLKVRGLVKQHLDSYNHLIGIEMQQIVKANELVTCEADPNFYMRFLDVSLGEPSDGDFHDERTWQKDHFTPQECRLRDITYSAPIRVRPAASRGSAQLRAYLSGAPPCLEWTGCIAHPIPVQSQPQLGPAPSRAAGRLHSVSLAWSIRSIDHNRPLTALSPARALIPRLPAANASVSLTALGPAPCAALPHTESHHGRGTDTKLRHPPTAGGRRVHRRLAAQAQARSGGWPDATDAPLV